MLLEAFQRLLIADPMHAAIRTLRAHFEAERMRKPRRRSTPANRCRCAAPAAISSTRPDGRRAVPARRCTSAHGESEWSSGTDLLPRPP